MIVPACAGVGLFMRSKIINASYRPRVCGGEPTELSTAVKLAESSPRMRG